MITHCLDTDILSSLIRREIPAPVVRRIGEVGEAAVCTTAITIGEIVYGVAKRGDPALAGRAEEVLSRGIPILAFDAVAARAYGLLRAELESVGRTMSEPDLRIASIVRARELTLVTHNVKHFREVPRLPIEDWLPV